MADQQAGKAVGPLVAVHDADDERLVDYRRLNDPDLRRRIEVDESIFVVEGRVAVRQLLASMYQIRSLFVDDRRLAGAGDLVAGVRSTGAPVFVGNGNVMAQTVGFDLHRGVVAIAERPDPLSAQVALDNAVRTHPPGGTHPLVAVLEGLNDAENIGAVFRNAAAFGVAAVLLDPTCGDPLYRRSVRVSVGHVLHVPFARLASWPQGLQLVRDAGFLIAALAPHPPPTVLDGPRPMSIAQLGMMVTERSVDPLGTTALPAGVALLLGAEGPGLSDQALAASDMVVSIPMAPNVDSLNVATAAAVAFHALTNQPWPDQ